jgi:hypothetical protein
LLLLTVQTSMKLAGLFSNTGMPGLNVQYILCQWAVAVKNTISMSKKSQTSVCNEDGDLPQDYTLASSEMPGELKNYKNEQHKKAMQARIIDEDAIRKAGL